MPPRRVLRILAVTLLLATVPQLPSAAQRKARPDPKPAAAAPQPQDEEFARLVREWTTRPEFLSPLVDHLPKSASVPSPRDVLGYHVGTPKKLTYYGDAVGYYRALAARTPRVRVTEIGATDEGRQCVVVTIASEETMRDLERHRADLAHLADPRGLGLEAARAIIARCKPIYHLMGGLHSGETGPPEMLMELAYRLAVEDSPIARAVRDNLIVTITPAAEPDGRDRYVDWYYRYRIDVTDERQRFPSVPYWGKYVFHDNNRDIHYSQVTMRRLLEWYLQWHPPIMHELHESVPFLYTFSGQAPQNPNLDPILYGELPWFANFEMAQLAKYGMPGVWTHAFVDMWSPGYLGFMASNHNGMLRMYETFGNAGATTMKRRVEPDSDSPATGGSNPTTREWYRPFPPTKEVEWSMRNTVNYMQTGVLTALELASAFPKVILENFYRKSSNAIEAGKKDAPFGWVIPAGQRDPTRVDLVVQLLLQQGIEVGRTPGEVKLAGEAFPAGSYVVKRDQPYGRLAKTLLEKQVFPDPTLRTYDDTAWSLGLTTHTDVREIGDLAILDVPVESVERAGRRGTVPSSRPGFGYAIPHRGSNRMITLRRRLGSLEVAATTQELRADGHDLPAGSFVVPLEPNADEVEASVRRAVEELGLEALPLESRPEASLRATKLPRLAVYSTWGNTQEVGWVRHALDHFEVPFDLIYKERVRRGGLRGAYDAILVPSQGRTAKGLVYDIEPVGRPIAYTRTEQFKNLGAYGSSDDITGGMGLEGVLELRRFVEAGGILMTLGAASFFPAEFGLTRTVDAARPSAAFYAPGPVVAAEITQPAHPIFRGYLQKLVPVRWAGGPLLRLPEPEREKQTLMRFQGGDAAVLSGLMRGANELRTRPAIVDVPVGRGRVVLFATNPCYRWQNHGEFNMLFNALLYFAELEASPVTSAPAPSAERE